MEVFMSSILLTPYDGAILGPIAKLLGWILNGIYTLLSFIGIENVGLSIILLTIVIYTCMLPLNYKQQKFSKLSQKMQPELKKIQDKYKGKKDQESAMAMNQETQLLYQKYGISPSGSCVQLLIQMPILFALYRVFYNVPAYINVVKDKFIGIADEIVHVDGFSDTMSEIVKNFKINLSTKPDFVITDSNTIDNVKNFVVDVLYKIPSVETLVTPNADGKVYFEGLSTVTEIVESGVEEFYNFNYFLGLNISNTPWNIIVENFNAKNYLLVFGALMIPVLAYLTQVLSIKLMQAKNNTGDQMAQQMKMMNTFMPFMSLIMCFSVPVGLGIYWIVSAAYRIPQQILLNRHFDKMDLEAVIKKNEAKVKAKREKMGISEEQMRAIANRKTRTLQNKAAYNNEAEKEEQLNTANEMRANAKPGSLAAKANMVRDYNERNSRK
jgi:YidC/Oxa1 family membrane protein insertase